MVDVLVLDDDPRVRLLVAEVLRDEGFRVAEAASLHQARLAFSTGRYEVLVADHDLDEPDGADGFSFAQAMRHERPSLGVIYMTARMERLQALMPGELTLHKPFRLVALIQQAWAASSQCTDPGANMQPWPASTNNCC